jgi:hypothetical protein
VVVLVAIAPFILFSSRSASADGLQSTTDAEAGFTSHIAQERSSRGLGALTTAADLVDLARTHSADMAAAGHPYHDPDIQKHVQNWQVMGDNVGSGPDEVHIHQGFMNSKVHRDEILYPSYTEVGVGCYWAGNVLYVTEIFRLPERAAEAAAPAPAPAPAARPAAAPRVAIRTVTVAQAAPASAPPAAPVTAPTTTAPPAPTTTELVRAPAEPSPPASVLAAHRSNSTSSPIATSVRYASLVAALLLMAVAGMEAHVLRRRATSSS